MINPRPRATRRAARPQPPLIVSGGLPPSRSLPRAARPQGGAPLRVARRASACVAPLTAAHRAAGSHRGCGEGEIVRPAFDQGDLSRSATARTSTCRSAEGTACTRRSSAGRWTTPTAPSSLPSSLSRAKSSPPYGSMSPTAAPCHRSRPCPPSPVSGVSWPYPQSGRASTTEHGATDHSPREARAVARRFSGWRARVCTRRSIGGGEHRRGDAVHVPLAPSAR
jgi:hypothetical protein